MLTILGGAFVLRVVAEYTLTMFLAFFFGDAATPSPSRTFTGR